MFLLWYFLIGLGAGFVAGWITGGSRQRLVVNLLMGVIGGVWGGWILPLLGLMTQGAWGSYLCAAVGAFALLWMARQLMGHAHKKDEE